MPLFIENSNAFSTYFQFEWNSASAADWRKIKHVFVTAYISSYAHVHIANLDIPEALVKQAEERKCNPLWVYFAHEFDGELAKIKTRDDFDKYKINYLTVKYQDQPVAFVASQLNFKSGRVYIRWNTVEPGSEYGFTAGTKRATFQGKGLGSMMLAEIAKFYDNPRVELYTRKLNGHACGFYKKNGLSLTQNFDFSEPSSNEDAVTRAKFIQQWLQAPYNQTIFPPANEAVSKQHVYIGFCKPESNAKPVIFSSKKDPKDVNLNIEYNTWGELADLLYKLAKEKNTAALVAIINNDQHYCGLFNILRIHNNINASLHEIYSIKAYHVIVIAEQLATGSDNITGLAKALTRSLYLFMRHHDLCPEGWFNHHNRDFAKCVAKLQTLDPEFIKALDFYVDFPSAAPSSWSLIDCFKYYAQQNQKELEQKERLTLI